MLSRHEFKVDEAASELSRCHAVELNSQGYAKWKEENLNNKNHHQDSNFKRKPSPSSTPYNKKKKCNTNLFLLQSQVICIV